MDFGDSIMTHNSRISTDDLAHRVEQAKPFYFWNVLTDEYFTGELIPGSQRAPVDTVGRETTRLGLPKDAEIVVYCASVTCPSSGQAAEKLAGLGYTNVKVYEGGVAEWKASGRTAGQLTATVAA